VFDVDSVFGLIGIGITGSMIRGSPVVIAVVGGAVFLSVGFTQGRVSGTRRGESMQTG